MSLNSSLGSLQLASSSLVGGGGASVRVVSTSDTNNTLDSVTSSHSGNIINITETTSQNSSLVRQVNQNRNIVDTLTLSDNPSRNVSYIIKTNEIGSTLASLSTSHIYIRQLSEINALSLNNLLNSPLPGAFLLGGFNIASNNDVLTVTHTSFRNTADVLSVSDAVSRITSTDYYVSLLSSLITSDGTSRVQNISKSIGDITSLSDFSTSNRVYVRFPTDYVAQQSLGSGSSSFGSSAFGSSSFGSSFGAGQQITSSSDSLTMQMSFQRAFTDATSITDVLTRAAGINKATGDGQSTFDFVIRNGVAVRTTTDTISVSDVINLRLSLNRQTNEQLNLLGLNNPLPGAFLLGGFNIGQGGVGDSLSRTYFASRNSFDNIVLYDSVTRTAIQFFAFKVNTISTSNFSGVRIVQSSFPLMTNNNWYSFGIKTVPSVFRLNTNSLLTIKAVTDPVRPDVNRHRSQSFVSGHKVRNS